MATLIIKRTSEWNNRMRDIRIYLDGERIGFIGNGQTKEFDVEAGIHSLHTKIDWCGSETITIELSDDESKEVELSGFKLGKWMVPFALIISVFYFVFGSRTDFSPLLYIGLLIPFLVYLIYILTIGRNKYLLLREL